MKILGILPTQKVLNTQYYRVAYELHFKTFSVELKRREIIRNFSISKEEFNRVLIDSMKRENES